MRVFVLGAGASYGRGGDHSLAPPLTGDFFNRAARLGLFNEEIFTRWQEWLEAETGLTLSDLAERVPHLDAGSDPGHLAVLKAFVEEQMDVAPGDYESVPLDIERLLGLIEGELLGYHGLLDLRGVVPQGPGPADVLMQQCYLILCGTLVATTAGSCPLHEELARRMEAGDLVVSFNYDLLMDRALRARGDWVIDDGYGLSFHRIGHRDGDEVTWRPPASTASVVQLLKPHGSLNWLYPRDAFQSNVNVDLHGIDRPTPPELLYCLEDMHETFLDDHPVYEWWERYEHHEAGRVFDMHALIVPPAVTKPYRNFEPMIGSVWANALKALLFDASHIVFVGYSFRPEDLRSWWLFRKVAAESEVLETIHVVDPSEAVFERVSDVFGGREVVRPAGTLADYVA